MNNFKKIEYDATGFGVTTLDYICIVDKIASYKKQAIVDDLKLFGGGCAPLLSQSTTFDYISKGTAQQIGRAHV